MIAITAYRLLQLVILAIFAIFISDHRRKPDVVPLIDRRLTLLMKLTYPISTIINFYALFTLDRLYATDFLSLALNAIGAGLVVLAKRDLGRCHTWTGYGSARSQLVHHGIYSVIRHPLYAGIYLFALGSMFLIIAHTAWFLVAVMIVTLGYILTFLAVAARREDRLLQKQLGAEYLAYQARVPAFFPIRWHRRPNHQ